jgi:hypothetical protein
MNEHEQETVEVVDPNETSEEFTARIIGIIEARMEVLSLRD